MNTTQSIANDLRSFVDSVKSRGREVREEEEKARAKEQRKDDILQSTESSLTELESWHQSKSAAYELERRLEIEKIEKAYGQKKTILDIEKEGKLDAIMEKYNAKMEKEEQEQSALHEAEKRARRIKTLQDTRLKKKWEALRPQMAVHGISTFNVTDFSELLKKPELLDAMKKQLERIDNTTGGREDEIAIKTETKSPRSESPTSPTHQGTLVLPSKQTSSNTAPAPVNSHISTTMSISSAQPPTPVLSQPPTPRPPQPCTPVLCQFPTQPSTPVPSNPATPVLSQGKQLNPPRQLRDQALPPTGPPLANSLPPRPPTPAPANGLPPRPFTDVIPTSSHQTPVPPKPSTPVLSQDKQFNPPRQPALSNPSTHVLSQDKQFNPPRQPASSKPSTPVLSQDKQFDPPRQPASSKPSTPVLSQDKQFDPPRQPASSNPSTHLLSQDKQFNPPRQPRGQALPRPPLSISPPQVDTLPPRHPTPSSATGVPRRTSMDVFAASSHQTQQMHQGGPVATAQYSRQGPPQSRHSCDTYVPDYTNKTMSPSLETGRARSNPSESIPKPVQFETNGKRKRDDYDLLESSKRRVTPTRPAQQSSIHTANPDHALFIMNVKTEEAAYDIFSDHADKDNIVAIEEAGFSNRIVWFKTIENRDTALSHVPAVLKNRKKNPRGKPCVEKYMSRRSALHSSGTDLAASSRIHSPGNDLAARITPRIDLGNENQSQKRISDPPVNNMRIKGAALDSNGFPPPIHSSRIQCPYIFIGERFIPYSPRILDDMKYAFRAFATTDILADETGYYIMFPRDEHGMYESDRFFMSWNHADMGGYKLVMRQHKYDRRRENGA